jgi:hypothetical protein
MRYEKKGDQKALQVFFYTFVSSVVVDFWLIVSSFFMVPATKNITNQKQYLQI